jgi:hypothetical protein
MRNNMSVSNHVACCDPRIGRPTTSPDIGKINDSVASPPLNDEPEQNSAQREEHHKEGIPPYEVLNEEYLEDEGMADQAENDASTAMKDPSPGWDNDSSPTKSSIYQVSIENPTIAAKDWVLVASGVVKYIGEEFVSRITVDVCIEAVRT